MIRQGEVYWLDLGDPSGAGPGYRRPCVIVQNDVFNQSKLRTTIVCALTTTMKRAQAPGNVSLLPGEAGLAEQGVVNVTQVLTVDKADLVEKIGAVSSRRIEEVVEGLRLVIESRGAVGL